MRGTPVSAGSPRLGRLIMASVHVRVCGYAEGLTDEDGADGEWHALFVDVALVEIVEHAVQCRDAAVLIADDGEVEGGTGWGEGVDVFHPAVVGCDVVGGEADELGSEDESAEKVGRGGAWLRQVDRKQIRKSRSNI